MAVLFVWDEGNMAWDGEERCGETGRRMERGKGKEGVGDVHFDEVT